MKKLFVLPVFIVLSIILNGQITITSSDFAPVGSQYTQITDTNDYQIDVSGTGHQIWDFSNLKTGYIDTFFIISPETSPYISNYPSCNYVVNIIGHDTSKIYQYMNAKDSLLTYGMNFTNNHLDTAFQTNIPFEYLSSLPITYNPTVEHILSYVEKMEMNYSNDPGIYQQISHVSDTIKVDAYGTLSLPNFSNLNALRISIHKFKDDTIYYVDEFGVKTKLDSSKSLNQTYLWFTNDSRMKFRALQIDINAKDTSIQFIKSASVATNLTTIGKNNIKIYPNPAKDYIRLSNIPTKCTSVDFIDAKGKIIKHVNKSELKSNISITKLETGIYLLRYNNTKLSKKLIVE